MPMMSTNPSLDPNEEVMAPLDRSLDSLVTGGIAAFGVGLLALVVTVASASGPVHELAHFTLPALLAAVIIRRFARRRTATPEDLDEEAAWTRARAARRWEAALAAAITGAVPLMWLVGGGAILFRHASDVASLALIVGVWIPLGAFLWGAAAYAFLANAREKVALGLRDSDRRFRAYWQNVGRVA